MADSILVKACFTCKQEKPASEFSHGPKVKKTGLSTYCNSCWKKYAKEYRKHNRDRNKAYNENRKEQTRQYRKEYYQKNKERLREKNRLHREANRERINAQKMNHYHANKPKIRNRIRRWMYGLTEAEHGRLLAAQNNGCAICGRKDGGVGPGGKVLDFHVDHCHTTGKVRGLLCNMCNLGLGCFVDRTQLLSKAIAYLRQSRGGWKHL